MKSSLNRTPLFILPSQYNYVANEWTKLNEEIKLLKTAPASEGYAHGSPPRYELDRKQLNGAAIREGNSILCTPLPQFDNSVLQTEKSMFFMPLPGVGEEDEDEDEDEDDEDEDEESSSEESDPEPSEKQVVAYPAKYAPTKADPSEVDCTSASHPYSCKCAAYSDDLAQPRKMIEYHQSARPTYVDHVKPGLAERPVQGGLTRNTPRYDGRRARSYSNPSTSSSRTQSSSRSASRSPSPPVRVAAPAHFGAAYTSPLAQDTRGLQATPQSYLPKNADGESLRTRLHHILTEPSTSSHTKSQVSASMAAREPRPARDERASSSSRSPSPPLSSNPHRPSITRRGSVQHPGSNDQVSRMLASHQPLSNGYVPPLSTSPNGRTSSASEAARALEQNKRERKQAGTVEQDEALRRRSSDREQSQPEREAERTRARSSSQTGTTASTASSASSGLHRSGSVAHTGAAHPSLASRPSTSSFHTNAGSNPAVSPPSAASYYSPASPYQHRYPMTSPNKGIPASSILLSPNLS